jgi:hypothetical protein
MTTLVAGLAALLHLLRRLPITLIQELAAA